MANPKHKPRKRFGQNFLTDQTIIADIVSAIAPTPSDHIVEIGPGQGALTEHLHKSAAQLDLIEIDRDLANLLKEYFKTDTVNIHVSDILAFDLYQLNPKPLRIVGNLPYNISTPILFYLLNFLEIIEDMSFMLQKEVVDRITATPGNKNYGRLSVMIQYVCQAQALLPIPPEAFNPKPKVDSAFFRLTPHKTLPHKAENFEHFSELVKVCFNHRRKTLNKTLKDHYKAKSFKEAGIDLTLRPETLSIEDFVRLANCV